MLYTLAEFLVNSYYEVPDYNRVNNTFYWSNGNRFWFRSLEARNRQGPFVIEPLLNRATPDDTGRA